MKALEVRILERKAAEAERKAAEQKRKAEVGRQARLHAERNASWFQAPTRKFEFDKRVMRSEPRTKTVDAVGTEPAPATTVRVC